MRLCRGTLSAHLAADVRALLPLPAIASGETGSAFVLNALIETERVVCAVRAIQTGRGCRLTAAGPHHIYRCPGPARWLSGASTAVCHKLLFVRVGTLDDPAGTNTGRTHLRPLETPVDHATRRYSFL